MSVVDIDALFEKIRPNVQASAGAPILGENKRGFVKRRVLQTCYGCPRLTADGTPCYVLIWQLVLFLLPAAGVAPVIWLIETGVVPPFAGAGIAAGILLVLAAGIRVMASQIRKRANGSLPAGLSAGFVADEDDIDFDGCFSIGAIDFVLPPKDVRPFEQPFHFLVYLVLGAGGTLYLLPSKLDALFATDTGNVTIFVLGWLAVLTAMYSVLVLPAAHPAVFRMQNKSFDLDSLHRPAYCIMLYVLRAVTYWAMYDTGTGPVDRAGYIAFAVLPGLWFWGLLPPLDAFLAWIAEQYLVIMLGGSPMATDLRLFLMVATSSVSFGVTYLLLDNGPTKIAVVWATGVGFILSCDAVTLLGRLVSGCSRGVKVAPLIEDGAASLPPTDSPPHPGGACALVDSLVFGGSVLAALLCHGIELDDGKVDLLDGMVWALWAIGAILRSAMPVYTACGLLRNPVYPGSVYSKHYTKQMNRIKGLGRLYKLIRTLTPVLTVAYVSVFFGTPVGNWALPAVIAFATTRSFRAASQSPDRALFEVAVLALVRRCVDDGPDTTESGVTWLLLPTVVQLSIIAFGHDRFDDLLDKLNFMLRFAFASWNNEKLRVSFTAPLLIGSAVLFPLVLAMVLVTVVLGSPLMPLFGLPLFFAAFPRPRRFWPTPGSNSSPKPETMYYEQATPQLSMAYAELASAGGLGIVVAGAQHMIKFEDRTVHIQVLEAGYDYTMIALKGLELRETTSCHDLESTRIGEMFDAAFEVDKVEWVHRNKHMDSVMVPMGSASIKSYSDKTYSQAGVIDSPETLANVNTFLGYTLIWVLQDRLKSPFPDTWRKTPTNTGGRNAAAQFSVHVPDTWIQKVVKGRGAADDGDGSANGDAWGGSDAWEGSDAVAERLAPVTDRFAEKFPDAEPEEVGLPGAILEGKSKLRQSTRRSTNFDDEFADIFSSNTPPRRQSSKHAVLTSVINGPPSGVRKQTAKHYAALRSVASSCLASATASPPNVSGVCTFFRGDIPAGIRAQPFIDSELEQLLLKAYRYAVKLALDNFDPTLPGELEVDQDEMLEDLADYDRDWYIGPEGSPDWVSAVRRNVQGLFSVLTDTSTPPNVKSRLLTTRKIGIRIGRLNAAAMVGQWASLTYELLYLTNDDDERYSIQAHETALRNLTIQAADPPLGYPVFNSRIPLPLI